MVKQLVDGDAFEEFSNSLFRLTRSLRSTSHLWVQLPGNLKRTDVSILRVLAARGDCRPGFIADQLNVGASVISRQLVSLLADGLVVRRKDPEDGRAELISLAPDGTARLMALREAYVRGMREQFTDWDTAKVNEAAALLDEISDHIVPALSGHKPRGTEPEPATTPVATHSADERSMDTEDADV